MHNNIYGTSLEAVEAVAASGKCCVLDIDVQGARQVGKPLVRRYGLHCKVLFSWVLFELFAYWGLACWWNNPVDLKK